MKRVLIINKDEELSVLMSSYTSNKENLVHLSYTFEDALKSISTNIPDVIFYDPNIGPEDAVEQLMKLAPDAEKFFTDTKRKKPRGFFW